MFCVETTAHKIANLAIGSKRLHQQEIINVRNKID